MDSGETVTHDCRRDGDDIAIKSIMDVLPLEHMCTNNSIVTIAEIGTGSAALFCNTTLPECCFSGNGGGWFLPNGNAINNNQSLPYYRTRAQYPGAILLHRNPGGTTTGIFCCDIPVAGGNQRLYVGIYTITTGESCTLSG